MDLEAPKATKPFEPQSRQYGFLLQPTLIYFSSTLHSAICHRNKKHLELYIKSLNYSIRCTAKRARRIQLEFEDLDFSLISKTVEILHFTEDIPFSVTFFLVPFTRAVRDGS